MSGERPKVFFSIPTRGSLRMEMVPVLRRLWQDPRVELVTCVRKAPAPLENALALLAREFLADGCDYWLNMDDDNPPQENPLDLVFLDLDFVGLPTPVYKSDNVGFAPIYWNAAKLEGESLQAVQPGTGLQKVDAHGGGCFLMSRRACEGLIEAHGRESFWREWDDRGVVRRGNDMAMTLRLSRLGFDVWTHWGYPCEHTKEIPLKDCYAAWAMWHLSQTSTRKEDGVELVAR